MGYIAMGAEDLERAMNLWSEALSIAMEIKNPVDIFDEASILGVTLAQIGNQEDARKLLNVAVEAGKIADLPQVQEVEEFLGRLESE